MCRRVPRSEEENASHEVVVVPPASSSRVRTLKQVWISGKQMLYRTGVYKLWKITWFFCFFYAEERDISLYLQSFKKSFTFCSSVLVCICVQKGSDDPKESAATTPRKGRQTSLAGMEVPQHARGASCSSW